MKVKSFIFGTATLLLFPLTARAQFYTIMQEKEQKGKIDTKGQQVSKQEAEEYFYAYQDSLKTTPTDKKDVSLLSDFFSTTEGHEISIEKDIPVFVNVKDSLLFGLIRERMDVCLPLDFISVSSRYGYRQDPFKKWAQGDFSVDSPSVPHLTKYRETTKHEERQVADAMHLSAQSLYL